MRKMQQIFLMTTAMASLAACGKQTVPSSTTPLETTVQVVQETETTTKAEETSVPTPTKESAEQTKEFEDLQSMVEYVEKICVDFQDDIEQNAEVLMQQLNDDYDTYDKNKDLVPAFYAQAASDSQKIYDELQSVAVDYYQCIAVNGLSDYEVWNDAMEDFYNAWNDGMDDSYNAWNEVFEDVYNSCDRLIRDASNDLDYKTYSDVWSAMYENHSDAWSAMYESYSDAWETLYENHSDVWSGFYKNESDVDVILGKKEGASSYTEIETQVSKDIEDTLTKLNEEFELLKEDVDSYKRYAGNVDKVSAFYEKVLDESMHLCSRMCEYSIDFAEAIVSSEKNTDDMYDDNDVIYDCIYDDGGDEIYDGIYDGLLDDMYDTFYSGILEDRPDGVEYAEWSNTRSDEYKRWSDARSECYEQWSDMRSEVYGFWSDVRSELWSDDIPGVKEVVEDFREEIQKMTGDNEVETTESSLFLKERLLKRRKKFGLNSRKRWMHMKLSTENIVNL